jgi:hypothetical protein
VPGKRDVGDGGQAGALTAARSPPGNRPSADPRVRDADLVTLSQDAPGPGTGLIGPSRPRGRLARYLT